MTQEDQGTQNDSSRSGGPIWILWLVAGALVLGCACSLGALFFLRQASDLGWVQDLWPFAAPTAAQPAAATATQPPAPAPTHTAVAALPSPTPSPTQEPTATAVPTRTATAVPTSTAPPPATATRTLKPTRTAAPTATKTTQAAPTPFVCDSLYELANIQKLAPGQTFQCTIQQQELTDLANNYPDSPCSEARFGFDDGEIDVVCRMGLRMQATLAPKLDDCRVAIVVLDGTPGFRRIVQELITTQFNVIRYDSICVDQIVIDDGQLTVGGYGR
jgi:hypothetical protein